ncbi:MAG: transposase [Methanobrevibacter sp.]|jgi:hypothetical protein|nr:transposase [Candidatus Methanovirga australis]
MWCIKEIDEEYRSRMYNILDLYAKDYDPQYPVVCLDEKPKQLLDDNRKSIPMKYRQSPKGMTIEYKRKGKANIFVAVDFKGGKRDVTVTDRRTKKDFAEYIKYLVDEVFTDAIKIKFVLDIIQISDLDGKQNL